MVSHEVEASSFYRGVPLFSFGLDDVDNIGPVYAWDFPENRMASLESVDLFSVFWMEEKDKFWTALDEVVESLLKEERVVTGAAFN